jgi:hypothetical protein
MSIIQISKIQQRAGNLVDLPQLDNAEFGWATDENRLFIGRTGNTVTSENIEVLTSYSNISFSQIAGSDGGNLNISNSENGQILTYVADTSTWENYPSLSITDPNVGGNANFKLNLGNVENLDINGGAIGYILQTDGTGNLSWTPKGTLYTNIKALTNNPTGNIITMTVANTVPYTNNALVTISGVYGPNANANANINSIINGQAFYIQLDVDFPTSGNVKLYTSSGNSSPANGAGLTATANTGIATSLTGGSGGGGGGIAGGVTTTVQYNDSGILAGSSGFTFSTANNSVTLTGNVNGANLNATSTVTGSVLVSNIATGTSPLIVTSTTQVANLNAATAGVAYSVAGANVSGAVSYATTANSVAGANVSGQVSYAATANSVAVANVSGIGNIATINLDGNASNILYGNGIFAAAPSPGVSYGNSNVATFLASFGSNTISTTGNITAGNISVGTDAVTLGTLTTGANTTAGTITGNFSLSAGSRLNATYADLAEYYEADKQYEAGTVLAFGGEKEVTLAEDNTTKVAGVVSTNPAYVMNSSCEGEHIVALALQGRVPCKVRGKISKGDMLVSGGNGFARPFLFPVLGTVIGKALENFEGEGVIEVAVSRL